MKLSNFSATHFRCLYDGNHIDFHPITVLIGENDSGKSATLDAMSIFLAATNPHQMPIIPMLKDLQLTIQKEPVKKQRSLWRLNLTLMSEVDPISWTE